ncbi:MAG: SBBP repeat-containing protein, partial [Bacteroidia bacterium]
MKQFAILSILIITSFSVFSQKVGWVKKQGGNSPDQTNGIVTDKNGNIIAVGTFDATANFGSNSLSTSGSLDIFVAKYDSTGTCLWAKKAGGSFGDEGRGVTVDGEGNIYITGTYGQSGAVFSGLTIGTTGGLRNGFIAKYKPDGSIVWVKSIGGISSSPEPRKIVMGKDSKVYVAGEFYGTITFNGSQQITSAKGGANDVFTAQFDTAGTAVWANRGGDRKDEKLTGLAIDADGNPIIYGSYDSLVTFGSTTKYAEYLGSTFGHTDLFLVKYSTSGGQYWFQSYGGKEGDLGGGICIDNAGNIYTTGYFKNDFYAGSVSANNSGTTNTLFLYKCNSSGNPVWVKFSPYPNSIGFARGMALAYANNEILLAGYFGNKYKAGNNNLTGGGENNPILIKYDTSGTQLWGMFGNGVVGKVSQGLSIAIKGKNYYYAGYITGSVSFNDSTVVAPSVYTDGFICLVKDANTTPSVGNPTSLKVNSATTSSIQLSWDGPSSEFRVLKKLTSSSTSATDGDLIYEGTNKSINLTGLTANTPYFISAYGKASGSATYSAGAKKLAATTVSTKPGEDVVIGFLAGDTITKTFGTTGVKISIRGASVNDGNIRVELNTNLTSTGTLPVNIDSIFNKLYWTVTNSGLSGGALQYCITVDVTKVWDLVGFLNFHILKRPSSGLPWEDLFKNTSYTVTRNSPELTVCGLSTFSEFVVGMANSSSGISPVKKAQFIVYPNPSSQKVSLDLTGTNLKTIQLYNSNGQLVKSIEVTSVKMEIEKGGLPNGLYLLKAGIM